MKAAKVATESTTQYTPERVSQMTIAYSPSGVHVLAFNRPPGLNGLMQTGPYLMTPAEAYTAGQTLTRYAIAAGHRPRRLRAIIAEGLEEWLLRRGKLIFTVWTMLFWILAGRLIIWLVL